MSWALTMEFRVQFLDRSGIVVREFHAYARNAAGAMNLVKDVDWPPGAVLLRILDARVARSAVGKGEGVIYAPATSPIGSGVGTLVGRGKRYAGTDSAARY